MAIKIQGIDISYCQSGLNYEKLKADGIKFAIIRASYTGTGTHKQGVDSLLNRHVNGCISQGIDYGFYHYSCAVSVAEARKEAQFCVEQIKKYPLPTYPVFFDAEEAQIANLGKKAATDIALAFVDEVERLGYPSGIYANPSWVETYLDKTCILGKKDLWLAHWVSNPKQYGQKLWQSGTRYSAGMQIDADVCYVDYPKETAAWYKAHGKTVSAPAKKTIDELVQEVLDGKWGRRTAAFRRPHGCGLRLLCGAGCRQQEDQGTGEELYRADQGRQHRYGEAGRKDVHRRVSRAVRQQPSARCYRACARSRGYLLRQYRCRGGKR